MEDLLEEKSMKNSQQAIIAEEEAAFARLVDAVMKYKAGYIASISLAVVGVAGKVIPYLLLAQIIGALIEGEWHVAVYGGWFAAMALSYAIGHAAAAISMAVSHYFCFKTLADIREKLLEKMYTMPLGYVQGRPTGEIKSIVVDGIESLEPTLAHVIPEMTANIIVPTFVVAYMIVLDWRIGLIGLAVVPLGLVLMMLAFKNYDVNFQKQVALSSKVNAALVEFVNGLEVIKIFNQDAQSYRRFKDAAEENAGFSIAWMNEIAPAAASAQVIMGASLLFVLPAGLFFMAQGTLETTVFLQLIVLTLSWVGPIVAAFKYPDQISAVRSTARRVFAVVNENDLVRPDSSSAARDASISLEDVCFSYDAENAEVLHGINLTLDEGCKLALVGPSGGGKSTIGKLIAGFWDPTKGAVRIGGADVRDISLEEAGKLISYVSQDAFLFDATIEENLRIGRPSATSEEIVEAARAAGCHDFIASLPQGYQTLTGLGGRYLSGGERQRVTIARAMLKDAPIVVMDEATAFTDPDSEAQIETALSALVRDKTLVVIAHRLSTVRDADCIAVVDAGRIVATGTHEELIATCPLYRDMWDLHVGAREL